MFCRRSHVSSFAVTATPGIGEKSTPSDGGDEGVMANGSIVRLEVDVFGFYPGWFFSKATLDSKAFNPLYV